MGPSNTDPDGHVERNGEQPRSINHADSERSEIAIEHFAEVAGHFPLIWTRTIMANVHIFLFLHRSHWKDHGENAGRQVCATEGACQKHVQDQHSTIAKLLFVLDLKSDREKYFGDSMICRPGRRRRRSGRLPSTASSSVPLQGRKMSATGC